MHPSNWEAYEIFAACWSQWRVAIGFSGGAPLGLHYPSVWTVITAYGCKKPGKVFKKIQFIETGALSVINVPKDVPDNATDSGGLEKRR